MSAVESLVIGTAVAAAVLYLGRAAWRHFRGAGPCGRCAVARIRPVSRSGSPAKVDS